MYKRKRITEDKIDLPTDHYFCDDIGLYAIYADPNFEYNFVSLTNKKDWDKLAFFTYRLALFNLMITGSLQLISFKDETLYLNGLWKRKIKSFSLNVLKPISGNDKFSDILVEIIKKSNLKYGKKVSLKNYIHLINDYYLGSNSEYNRPEKHFIIGLIEQYAKTYNWISIKSERKMLGIYKQHKIELNPIYSTT